MGSMKPGSAGSFFTYLMFLGILGVGVLALVVYVILPGIDNYHLDQYAREVEKEGEKEAQVPTNQLLLPGPAAEKMIPYGKKAIPYLIPLLGHIEFRVRAKAWDAFKKVSKKEDFLYDPQSAPIDAKSEVDKIRNWWEKEKTKPEVKPGAGDDSRRPLRAGSRAL
jgi:hypothetical protein